MVLSEFEEEKVKEIEATYPDFRKDFQKYEMAHYYLGFSRGKKTENSKEELENILKCLKPYYDYFTNGDGTDFLKYYTKNVIKAWHKFPKLMDGGDSYVIRVFPPNLTIAMVVQALPYMDAFQQSYAREALQLALASSRSYPETFVNLKQVKESKVFTDCQQKCQAEMTLLYRKKQLQDEEMRAKLKKNRRGIDF